MNFAVAKAASAKAASAKAASGALTLTLALSIILAGCQSAPLAIESSGAIAAPIAVPGPVSALTPIRIPPSEKMPEGAAARAPAGFFSFCIRNSGQCEATPSGPAEIVLTPASWRLLEAINAKTNGAIIAEDDRAHYGRAEYWTIPQDGFGDCEDYALSKRKQLMAAGLPERALRVATVRTRKGERHTVLTVATTGGDYVLDNLTSEIRPWRAAPYVWLARQGIASPFAWVALNAAPFEEVAAAVPAASKAGRQRR